MKQTNKVAKKVVRGKKEVVKIGLKEITSMLEPKLKMKKSDITDVLNDFFKEVLKILTESPLKNQVKTPLGTFSLKERGAIFVNKKIGQPNGPKVELPARLVLGFKVSTEIKQNLIKITLPKKSNKS